MLKQSWSGFLYIIAQKELMVNSTHQENKPLHVKTNLIPVWSGILASKPISNVEQESSTRGYDQRTHGCLWKDRERHGNSQFLNQGSDSDNEMLEAGSCFMWISLGSPYWTDMRISFQSLR